MKPRPLPEGYEIKNVNDLDTTDGRFTKIVPYFEGRAIAEGRYPDSFGYKAAIRRARRICRLHHKFSVKPKPPRGY